MENEGKGRGGGGGRYSRWGGVGKRVSSRKYSKGGG